LDIPAIIASQSLGVYRPRLVFLDTGLITELSEENSTNFVDLFSAVADGDGIRAAQLMVDRARAPSRWYWGENPPKCIDYNGFVAKMQHVISRVQHDTFRLANIHIGDVLGQVPFHCMIHPVGFINCSSTPCPN
jgi:aarF domain-containing kinase